MTKQVFSNMLLKNGDGPVVVFISLRRAWTRWRKTTNSSLTTALAPQQPSAWLETNTVISSYLGWWGVRSKRYEIGTILPLGEKRYTGNLYTCQPVTPPSPYFMMVSCLIAFLIKKKYLIYGHKNANYIQVHRGEPTEPELVPTRSCYIIKIKKLSFCLIQVNNTPVEILENIL